MRRRSSFGLTSVLSSLGTRELAVLAFVLLAPVPTLAASGLSVPLPPIVARVAASLVPGGIAAESRPGSERYVRPERVRVTLTRAERTGRSASVQQQAAVVSRGPRVAPAPGVAPLPTRRVEPVTPPVKRPRAGALGKPTLRGRMVDEPGATVEQPLPEVVPPSSPADLGANGGVEEPGASGAGGGGQDQGAGGQGQPAAGGAGGGNAGGNGGGNAGGNGGGNAGGNGGGNGVGKDGAKTTDAVVSTDPTVAASAVTGTGNGKKA
jgi:hypothetical protein